MDASLFPIPPLGLEPADLDLLREQVRSIGPDKIGGVWCYSIDRKILLVGVVKDGQLQKWLMQPAETQVQAWATARTWLDALRELSLSDMLEKAGRPSRLPPH
jgi:hypothetical protein